MAVKLSISSHRTNTGWSILQTATEENIWTYESSNQGLKETA